MSWRVNICVVSRQYFIRLHHFRYILNLASESGAIVVSNDHYRELINDKKEFFESTIETEGIVKRIFACATMWHETESEMTGFLQSILEMDKCVSGR